MTPKPSGNGLPTNPLTPDHLAQIKNALDAAKAAQYQIELAKRAGIDVSSLEDTNNENVTKLRQILQVYFPGQ
jgi:hypothetical protein